MENFLQKIKTAAKKNPKRIAFPDFAEARVAAAIAQIKSEGIAIPVQTVIDPKNIPPDSQKFAESPYKKLKKS